MQTEGVVTWLGEINNVKKHISTDCLFVDVFCPSKCGLKLKRQCVQLHLSKECPCHCQYCGTTGSKEEISRRHKKHCIQCPIPCPNGCDLGVVPSLGVAAHRKVCPLEVIHCEYVNVGCKVTVTRRELEDHYKHNVVEHLNLTSSKLNSVTEEISKTEKKLAMTAKELDNTKLKYNRLEGRITNVNKDMIEIKSKQRQHAGELAVPQPITDCAKRKFFESRLYRLSTILFCILSLHIIYVNITNERLSQTEQSTWPKTLNKLSTSDNNQVAPVIFKIPDYRKKLYNDETWFSPLFFAIEDECMTWLTVKFYKDEGLLVSLLFKKNTPEDTCSGTRDTIFTVELLNQLYNSDHFVAPFYTDNDTCRIDEETVLYTIYFVSYSFLQKKSDKYLKNGNAYLRITHDRSIYNYLYWLIWKIIGPVKSISEYHAYILWLIIAVELILEFRDSLLYEAHVNGSRFALLNKASYGTSLACFIALILYMLYCIGLFTM